MSTTSMVSETDTVYSPFAPVRRFELFFLFSAVLLSSLWCVTSARKLGATFDEPFYLEEGMNHWRTGSYQGLMRLGTMPLPVDVQTLPLYLWEKARRTPFDVTADFHRLLPWARAANLVFWWMLLFYVWRIARSLGGPWAGVVALLFLAFEPSLIAHASLATTDIAATTCLVALLYHYVRNREEKSWWWRVAWPGFWFGLAILAKAYGLVFGGLCLFVVEAWRCSEWRQRPFHALWVSLRSIRPIVVIGLFVLFVYVGSDWKAEPSFVAWSRTLPESAFGSSMQWLAENLCIFTNAGSGLARQVTHNVRGHGVFLLEQTHPRALWYYFPVLLTIKLTVPLLLGAVLLGGKRFLSRTWAGNWPLQAALAMLLFTPFCRVQIGIRFMFPLMALLIAGLAPVMVEVIREAATPMRRRLFIGLPVVCCVWTVAATYLVWPHGLCYVNSLWGGTDEGYRLVSDSNYDWGQGIKELRKWQQQHRWSDMDVWCYTTDPDRNRLMMRQIQPEPLAFRDTEDFLQQVRGRRLAISTTLVHGALSDQRFSIARSVLRQREPVARTTTYLIYDFTREVPSDSRYIGRGDSP